MFAVSSRTCFVLIALLAAARHVPAAAPPAPRPFAGDATIQVNVVLAEVYSPIRSLKSASHPLTYPQFPLAGILASSQESAGYLKYLERLEKRERVKILSQPRLVCLSGAPASFLCGGEQAVPVPAGLGQVGVQFEEFGIRVDLLPVLLEGATSGSTSRPS
jgi:Flp pilus assembly secretin CpaC